MAAPTVVAMTVVVTAEAGIVAAALVVVGSAAEVRGGV